MIRNAATVALAAGIAPRLEAIAARRSPDFIIGGAENPYMNRWRVVPRNLAGNAHLHEYIRDDDDRALHDHPWWSLSLCLRGRLVEVYRRRGTTLRREILPGSLVFRSGRFAHRLEVPEPGSLTLFLTGPRFREWGFYCPQGWRHWREFTAPGDRSRVGRGCD